MSLWRSTDRPAARPPAEACEKVSDKEKETATEHLPDIEIVRDLSLFSLVPAANMEALAQIGNELPVRLYDDSVEVLDAIILFNEVKNRRNV